MISTPEADAVIRRFAANCKPGTENVSIAESIGRVLAEDIFAERDQPPFDRVAMDGIALCLDKVPDSAIREVAVVGTLKAGDAAVGYYPGTGFDAAGSVPLALGQLRGIEVMTGAALPEPWDTVVPVEDFEMYVWGGSQIARLRQGVELRQGSHIHRRASDYRHKQLLLEAGERIAAPHMHISASNGYPTLKVYRKPRIAVLSTGDELVATDASPGNHQIRRSNPLAIRAQLELWGYTVSIDDHIPDDPAVMEKGIRNALNDCDLLLLSGGVSMGSHDLVPAVLEKIGCMAGFHGVAIKPGKPLYFAMAPEGALVFGLPGNPVSALVTCRRFVVPFLPLLEGGRELEAMYLSLADGVPAVTDKTRFVPVLLENHTGKPSKIRAAESKGSGNFFSLLPSDGIAEIPPGQDDISAGTEVAFYPWERGR